MGNGCLSTTSPALVAARLKNGKVAVAAAFRAAYSPSQVAILIFHPLLAVRIHATNQRYNENEHTRALYLRENQISERTRDEDLLQGLSRQSTLNTRHRVYTMNLESTCYTDSVGMLSPHIELIAIRQCSARNGKPDDSDQSKSRLQPSEKLFSWDDSLPWR